MFELWTYELSITYTLFWALNRNIFKVPQAFRAKFLKKNQQKSLKTEFYNFFTILPDHMENPKTEGSRELFLPEMISKLDPH